MHLHSKTRSNNVVPSSLSSVSRTTTPPPPHPREESSGERMEVCTEHVALCCSALSAPARLSRARKRAGQGLRRLADPSPGPELH